MEFRADDRVRKSANLHVQMCTEIMTLLKRSLVYVQKTLFQVRQNIMLPVIKILCGLSTNQKNQRVLV